MKLITAALLFLLTIPGLYSQARIQQLEENTPFEGVVSGCSDGVVWKLLPEPFAIVGSINFRRQITENANSTFVTVKTNTKGTAVGLVTKVEYKFNEQTSSKMTFDSSDAEMHFAPEETRYTANFNIPGLYKIHHNIHMGYKDSVFKIIVNNLRVHCPTAIDYP
jgi:hypothetical protein